MKLKLKVKYIILLVLFLLSFSISIFYVREYKYIQQHKFDTKLSSIIINRFDIYKNILIENQHIEKDNIYTINNNQYYINKNGYLHIGWIKKNDKKYYSDINGKLKKDIIRIENNNYYFDKNFKMYKGWLNLNSHIYYFDNKGIMIQNKMLQIKDYSYLFDKNGCLITDSLVPFNNENYYVNKNGEIQYNQWIKYNNKSYYLNNQGYIVKNQWIDGNYLDNNGELDLLKRKYERDGEIVYTNQLESELKKIPQTLLNDFLNKEWKIILTSKNLQDYNDDQKNQDKTVLGVTIYKDKTIYIKDVSNLSLSVLHEFGHYLDYTYQFLSNSPEFLECFNLENNQFSVYYNNNHFSLNSQELFAEVYCKLISEPEICKSIVPKTSTFIENKIYN